ncbi:MAG: S41 family peptidase [Janthinobacterium lividum]
MKQLVVVAVGALLCGAKLRPAPATSLAEEKHYSRQQIQEDITYLTTTLGHVHPNMYHAISQKRYQQLTDSVRGAVRDTMTEQQVWPLLGRLVGALREGHSTLDYTAHEGELLKGGGRLLFPVVVQGFDGTAFVVRADASAEDKLRVGDKIIRLNGRSASQLVDVLSTHTGGLKRYRALDICRNLVVYMHLYGIAAPYRVTYRRGTALDSVTLSAASFDEYKRRLLAKKPTLPPVPEPVQYALTFPTSDHALLQLNSLRATPARFKQFLDSSFTILQHRPTNTLVVDLRQNGGGNSALAQLLLGYLTTKPFRMTGGVKWKVSQEYKDQLTQRLQGADAQSQAVYASYFAAAPGSLLETTAAKPARPPANPLCYQGKIKVLIGPRTFSSANMLANTMQDYRLATLIGAASGEPANDYGELIALRLPNTGIPFTTSTKQFIRANGQQRDPNPVLPDYTVADNPLTPLDEVLAFALDK